jgi:hypothetical protein
MRIVIEVEGEQVTSVVSEGVVRGSPAMPPNAGDSPPGPAPKELLARAKELGALSAGPALFGVGAALAATADAGAPVKLPATTRRRRGKQRARRK